MYLVYDKCLDLLIQVHFKLFSSELVAKTQVANLQVANMYLITKPPFALMGETVHIANLQAAKPPLTI